MKKILFAAVAVCGLVVSKAQTVPPIAAALGESKHSTSTSTLAGSVNSQFDLKLTVHNVIRIIPDNNYDLRATLQTAADMDNGKALTGSLLGVTLPGVGFGISSNRDFHVDMTAAATATGTNGNSVVNGNNVMPISVFEFKATAGPGVPAGVLTMPSAVTNWGTLGTSQALVSNGDYGIARTFGIEFRVKKDAGWLYEGGKYDFPITVTATQD